MGGSSHVMGITDNYLKSWNHPGRVPQYGGNLTMARLFQKRVCELRNQCFSLENKHPVISQGVFVVWILKIIELDLGAGGEICVHGLNVVVGT